MVGETDGTSVGPTVRTEGVGDTVGAPVVGDEVGGGHRRKPRVLGAVDQGDAGAPIKAADAGD